MSAGPAIVETSRLTGMACLRCETHWPVAEYEPGCPRCAAEGHAANLRLVYSASSDAQAPEPVALPYPQALSLGEGATPLVEVPELAAMVGVGRLSLKLEWCNPTGSHKDRMSAQLVARAADRRATRIVAASSGNGGLSIAAYAARAGIPAEIATGDSLPEPYRRAIARHGAALIACADSMARWRHLARRVAEEGAFAATNYRLPAIGTNPFGIEGYKAIAAEIAAAGLPDLVVAPCSRGDLLSGLHLGFAERRQGMPRLIAAEPFPRLASVLAGADYRESFAGETAQFSIAGSTVTWQAVQALRASSGLAVPVADEAALLAHASLAACGFHAELSAASALAALRTLAKDGGLAGRHAVLVLTGSGFRDLTAGEPAAREPHRDRRPEWASAQPAQTGASPRPTIQQRDNG